MALRPGHVEVAVDADSIYGRPFAPWTAQTESKKTIENNHKSPPHRLLLTCYSSPESQEMKFKQGEMKKKESVCIVALSHEDDVRPSKLEVFSASNLINIKTEY
ncbi:hypothetical protein PAMP_016983 [Pampus punctatissimus]